MGAGQAVDFALKEAELRAKQDGQTTEQQYYFIHRNTILSYEPGTPLPIFQSLQHGQLQPLAVNLRDAVHGHYRSGFVCLSHRWETREHPDPRGEQLAALQQYFRKYETVEWAWVDYCCMPQCQPYQQPDGTVMYARNQEEEMYFGQALQNVNMLYANMQVCILFDRAYNSRFWCLLEAILGLSNPTPKGLTPSKANTHHHFECMGSLRGKTAQRTTDAFVHQWWEMPYTEALDVLKSDDVTVTNQSDKERQLTRLFDLQGRIQRLMQPREQQAVPIHAAAVHHGAGPQQKRSARGSQTSAAAAQIMRRG